MIEPGRCNYPQQVINIDPAGRLHLCICEDWLPVPIGHVMDFDSMQQVFATAQAQQLDETIQDGSYRFCQTGKCGVARSVRSVAFPTLIVGVDDSCQLACPSCRRQAEFHAHDHKSAWMDRLRQWIAANPLVTNVLVGAHGDPLTSALYRGFLASLAELPVVIQIKTNGLLMRRHLGEMGIWHKVSELSISIDAGTAAVYEDLRRPARWSQLLDNLEYLRGLRQQRQVRLVRANLIMQSGNLEDIPAFLDLCQQHDMLPSFSVLEDWRVMDDYEQHAVHLPQHPQHERFLEIIEDDRVNPNWRPSWT
jgi:MoaA/NifB/PqqE/SkfB family radical SAM enzyme